MPDSITIRTGQLIAGILSPVQGKTNFVFRAANPLFATLDGSSFANRHAIQRAVERLAAVQGAIPYAVHAA